MKIILVVTDSKRKNLVFVSDKLEVFSLDEAVRLAKEGKIEGVHVVKRSTGSYIRTDKRIPKSQELEKISISSFKLFNFINDVEAKLSEPLTNYLKLYRERLDAAEAPFIQLNWWQVVAKERLKKELQANKDHIFQAAKRFNIDPYLLGAILIDEIARMAPIERLLEPIAIDRVGKNTSIGIAQIKIETARDLIMAGYYNPNVDDPELSKDRIIDTPKAYIAKYVVDNKHNIFLAAARTRYLIDRWKVAIDISSRLEIIATLYSLNDSEKKPHADPHPNKRGSKIINEFYQLSKKYLDSI